MLSRERLVELYRELRDEPVLSVYLDGDQHDPAERDVWRRHLDQQLADVRTRIEEDPEASAGDLDRLAEATTRIREKLNGFDAFLPGKGWVGFATPDQLWYSESMQVPMPDLVRWEKGIRVAPYVRALKQQRSVILVLVDSRRARVFRYLDGEVTEPADLRADTFMGDLSDIGQPKRATNRSGVRGKTSTDAAQTFLAVGEERMLKELMDVVAEKVGDHGFLVLGGTSAAVSAAMRKLPNGIRDRTLERPSLHVEMKEDEVRGAAEEAASELTQQLQHAHLDDLLDRARSGGLGCLGMEETIRALVERRVGLLLLSRNLIRDAPDVADRAVGTAFEQNAEVEELSALAAEKLDAEAEGIGAVLRFRVREREDVSGEDAA